MVGGKPRKNCGSPVRVKCFHAACRALRDNVPLKEDICPVLVSDRLAVCLLFLGLLYMLP
jgi:hypothetical protein